MVIPHYYVPFESGNIYVHKVTAPGNCRAVVILPGRSMSGRNFWHFDPGTGTTHAEQLAAQGIDVYMVDALGFGNSTGVSRPSYSRIYFAEQIGARWVRRTRRSEGYRFAPRASACNRKSR